MTETWDDKSPIYRQLRNRVARLIMDGSFAEGEAIPSVRQVSSDFKINHLTVSKAYQALVDAGVLEMRRGRGMFVLSGAQDKLLAESRKNFEENEIPKILDQAKQLGISKTDLIAKINTHINDK